MAWEVYYPVPLVDEYSMLHVVEHGQDELIGDSSGFAERCWSPTPTAADWVPVSVYPADVRLPWPDFWYLNAGAAPFVVSDRARGLMLADELSFGVEFLPLRCDDVEEPLWLLHVMGWPNVIDEDATTFSKNRPETMIVPEFHEARLGGHWLFNVPSRRNSHVGDICTPVDLDEPEEGFKAMVERVGLTGLRFDLVWSRASGGVLLDEMYRPDLEPGHDPPRRGG